MNMRRSYKVTLVFVCLWVGGAKARDWWTHRHLITLDAENAEIYSVLQEIARQSSVPVLSRTNVTGRVTVHFHRTPVEDALVVLADQTDGSWQKLYLVGRNHLAIQKVADGIIQHGPPFLLTQLAATGNDSLAIRELSATNELAWIDFKVAGKELQTASLELALKAKTSIAVEETLNPVVTLEIKKGNLPSAVQGLARTARASAEMAYHFSTPGGRGRRDGEGTEPSSQDNASDGWRARREELQKIISQQIELLPPEEKQKALQQREEWGNLSPEERRKKWNEMGNSPEAQARAEKRFNSQLKNLTPEQWATRYKRYVSRQKKQQGA